VKKKEKLFHIVDKNSLGIVIRAISKIVPSKEKPYRIRVTLDSEDRTLKQNKLAFLWHKVRSTFNGHTINYDRRFCKLTYGVPLLLADSSHSEFQEFYYNALLILPYEELIQAMEFVPVTRIMSTKLFAEYLDVTDKESANQGIILPKPIDLYREAMIIQEDSKK